MDQPKVHIKNTFLEVESDSDDSLDISDSWMRASTEPAKVFPPGKLTGKAEGKGKKLKEPQYVYPQGDPVEEAHATVDCDGTSSLAAATQHLERLRALEFDPELAPIFDELKKGGTEAASKLCMDAVLMRKISRKLDAQKQLQVQDCLPDDVAGLNARSPLAGMDDSFVRQMTLNAIRTMPCSVTLADPNLEDCPLIGCSEGFEALTGYSQKEIVGKNCRFLNRGVTMDPTMRLALRDSIANGNEFVGVLTNARKNGELFNNLLRMTTVFVRGNRYIIGVQADVSNINIDLHDPVHLEQFHSTAGQLFSNNIDAWIQIQARQHYLRQPLPYPEMLQALFAEAERPQEVEVANQFVVRQAEGSFQEQAMASQAKASKAPKSEGSSPVVLSEQSTSAGGCDRSDQHSEAQESDRASNMPLRSIGSRGHPDSCNSECIFYFFRDGCRAAENCRFCHEFHPRKNMKKNRRILRRLCSEAPNGEAEAEESAAAPRPAGPLPAKSPKAPKAAVKPVAAAPIVHEGTGLRYWYGPEGADGGEERLTVLEGQAVHLPAHIEIGAEQKQQFQDCLCFSVQPALPAGLSWDVGSGLITGAPEKPQPAQFYTFTASVPATGPNGIDLGQMNLASCRLSIKVASLKSLALTWGREDDSGATTVTFSSNWPGL